MAGMAEDQGFPSAGSHDLNPLWLLSPGVLFQVFERPDVVNLDFLGHASYPALFAHLSQQSLFEFRSFSPWLLL